LKKGNTVVTIDPNYYRPTEVDLLIGDPTKAKKLLGWKAKTKFEDLVQIMIKSDMDKVLRRGY
jgi:GDPmannose 4,6-dehydratase